MIGHRKIDMCHLIVKVVTY